MTAKHIAMIVLAGLAAVFIIQNAWVVELRFLFWTLPMSCALLMFFMLSVGTLLGWLLRGIYSRKKSDARTKHAAAIAE